MPITRVSRNRILAGIVAAVALAATAVTAVAAAPDARADTPVTLNQRVQVTLEMSECGVMYVGTTGTCIVSLQYWLNYIQDAHLAVDGIYGQATLVAVERWQRTYLVRQYHKLADGHFGAYSRLPLHQWYWNASDGGKHIPCQPRTGQGCDPGAAEPGIHGGIPQIVGCAVVGELTAVAGGVACEVLLD